MAKTTDNNGDKIKYNGDSSTSNSGSSSSEDSGSENSDSSSCSSSTDNKKSKKISGRKPQNCRHCNKQYLNSGGLYKHEKRCQKNENSKAPKSEAGTFTCKDCNQSFRYLTGLTRHEKRHTGEGGFSCKQCGAKFRSDAERTVHKEANHRVIKCQLCDDKFDTDEDFFKHINVMHDGKDREYTVCSDCGQQFRTNIQLKYHMESKCGTQKQWICEECNSRFMTKSTLRAHKLIHEGLKKHLCNFCGNSFLSKGQLKVHERSHTGEKPFICQVCNKGFAYRESLVTHTSLHTGIKPYLCEGCGSRFSCIGNLIKHRKARPDSCGLPQFSTNTKVAPRASAKRTRARRPRGPYKKDQLVISVFPEFQSESNTSDYQPNNASLLETSQVLPRIEMQHENGIMGINDINSSPLDMRNHETNNFNIAKITNSPQHVVNYNNQYPNNANYQPSYGFNVNNGVFPPSMHYGEQIRDWTAYPVFQNQSNQNSYPIYDQYNMNSAQPSVIMPPQNYSNTKNVPEEIKSDPEVIETIKPELSVDLSEAINGCSSNALVDGTTKCEEIDVGDGERQLCFEELVKVKLEEGQSIIHNDNSLKKEKKKKHKLGKHKKKKKERKSKSKSKKKKHEIDEQEIKDLDIKDIPAIKEEETKDTEIEDKVAEIIEAPMDTPGLLDSDFADNDFQQSSGSEWNAELNSKKQNLKRKTEKKKNSSRHNKWRKTVYTSSDDSDEDEPISRKTRKRGRKPRTANKQQIKCEELKAEIIEDELEPGEVRPEEMKVTDVDDSDGGADHIDESPDSDVKDEEEDLTMPPDLHYPTESKTGRPLFSCKFCMKEYSYVSALAKHEKSHHNLEGAVLEQKRNKTPKNKHNKQTFNCKYCFKKYLNLSVLIKHEKDHGPEGKLLVRCSCCRKYFETKEQCLAHQARVHYDRLACQQCSKIFKEPDNLTAHIKYAHSGGSLKKYTYMCPTCGKNFTSKLALGDHERSNCGRNPIHICDVCQKSYTSAASLKTHMTVHSGVLPHLCNYCGKAFRTQGQVKVHERSHSGEKPFKCEFCPKAFAYRESLITHRSLHTGIKKHLCHGCGSRFSCISNLQAHRKSHKSTCGLESKNQLSLSSFPSDSEQVFT